MALLFLFKFSVFITLESQEFLFLLRVGIWDSRPTLRSTRQSYLIPWEHPAFVLEPQLSSSGIVSHQHFPISSLWLATLLLEAWLLSCLSNQAVPGLSTDKINWLRVLMDPSYFMKQLCVFAENSADGNDTVSQRRESDISLPSRELLLQQATESIHHTLL